MSPKQSALKIKNVMNSDEWELLLNDLSTSSTYLKWPWGNYKRNSGWDVKRLNFFDSKSKQSLACCQIQSKCYFFVNVYLIQGGIHLSKKNDSTRAYDNIIEALCAYIKNTNRLMWLFLINNQTHQDDTAITALLKNKFSPILSETMFTYIVFKNSIEESLLELSSNWRHNLKRANKNENLEIEWITSYRDRLEALSILSKMYVYLLQRKNFKSGIDLKSIYDEIAKDKSMIIAQAKLHNEVVAIRVASVCNDHILDLIAASNEGAKNCYANYLLMWRMILKMNEFKKKFFDTGGIDPANNSGVYNFKKGLNGKLTINGPLWLLASNAILNWVGRIFFR